MGGKGLGVPPALRDETSAVFVIGVICLNREVLIVLVGLVLADMGVAVTTEGAQFQRSASSLSALVEMQRLTGLEPPHKMSV